MIHKVSFSICDLLTWPYSRGNTEIFTSGNPSQLDNPFQWLKKLLETVLSFRISGKYSWVSPSSLGLKISQRNNSLHNSCFLTYRGRSHGIWVAHRPAALLLFPFLVYFKLLELKNKDNTLTLLTGWDSLKEAYFVHWHSPTAEFKQTDPDLPARKQNTDFGLQLPA